MTSNREVHRYAGMAIAFHWAIAFLILLNFPIAWTMGGAKLDKNLSFALFQLHKTIGLTVLLLSVGRLAWRLMNPPPPLPAGLKPWERLLSSTVHVLFYLLMIAVPLLGWMMVSASPTGIPTMLFGFIQWPHIEPLAQLTPAVKKSLHGVLSESHEVTAFGMLFLVALHIGGALKHQFIDKSHYLVRMLPGLFGRSLGPVRRPNGTLLALGSVLMVAVLGAAMGASTPPKSGTKSTAETAKLPTLGPNSWVVVPSSSHIKFASKHSGKAFTGTFERWSASITFDPTNLTNAHALVTIQTGSAKTGDAYYDRTLPEADWFDTATFANATYETRQIRALGEGRYEAVGQLMLHGITQPLAFAFSLDIAGDIATMKASIPMKRLDFNVGKGSDSGAEWVDDTVILDVLVVAKKPLS